MHCRKSDIKVKGPVPEGAHPCTHAHHVAPCRQHGRIPLPDLVRFKERQWFVEELEVGREGSRKSGRGGGGLGGVEEVLHGKWIAE